MTDHIKMNDIIPRITYVGNGSQTVFPFPFPIFSDSDLIVTLDHAVQSSGFTLSGAGQSNGGSITFATAPANNVVIMLERRLPLQRISDFLEGGEFSANALNNELDYLAGSIQQLASDLLPMLHVEPSEDNFNTVLPGKTQRANKVLGFDSDGQMAMMDTESTYSVPNFTAIGTGTVTRTLTDKARESVSIKDFGAVGDGIADDTNAIITALAAHSCVYVPAGTYRVTQTIGITDSKLLYGDGKASVIKANSNAFDTMALIGSYSTIRDLTIDSGDSGLRLYGKTSPCLQNIIQNIVIQNVHIGIELDGYSNISNQCYWNSFNNIAVNAFAVSGIWIQVSGAGKEPAGNKFHSVRVNSSTSNSTGSGFHIQAAKYNNAFLDCEAHLASTAVACFRIGPNTSRNLIANLYTNSTGSVPNIWLESGSQDTSITNLDANSSGLDIFDESNGSYSAVNAGSPIKNRLRRTRISDLTMDMQRYNLTHIAPVATATIDVDLTNTMHLVNATNGTVTMRLPLAAAANTGTTMTIKKIDNTTNIVQISENGGNGPDNRVVKISTLNDYVTVMSDGTKWRVIAHSLMPYGYISIDTAGTYKPDMSKQLVLGNATAGMVIVELPPANSAQAIGRFITIKKTDASANVVRITEEGAVGPDGAIVNLGTRYQALTVFSNAVSWNVLHKYL
ncbi:MAG TPA: glycosyl hydrolase family 28-related protein [Alphaproteobacteria bacterium]